MEDRLLPKGLLYETGDMGPFVQSSSVGHSMTRTRTVLRPRPRARALFAVPVCPAGRARPTTPLGHGSAAVGVAALVRVWQVFPFQFSTEPLVWALVARSVLGFALVAGVVAIVVQLVRLPHAVTDREH
ncbi:hypothetical protein [Actinoplanes sandaracinus]|uniref:hypothetical protein n=1 Tax=Actinoplanes sandaracinus TaxID=3045177 RepID=UPI0024A88F49|nr:hypothetical protein [Actinoplanes sandaracinus]